MRPLVILVVCAGCTPTQPPVREHRESVPPSRAPVDDEPPWPEPECEELPSARPPGLVITVSRRDGETMEHTLDAAFVADAPCPDRLTLPDPDCMHLPDEVADAMWAELVAMEPHRIGTERHGECIHCGGPSFSITWDRGECYRGTGVFDDIPRRSWDRFDRVVAYLEGVALRVQSRVERD